MKIALVLLILSTVKNSCGVCSSEEYGDNSCAYTPAPPGQAPLCAKPGLTYCEHPVRYPRQLIHFLIDKWQFNFTTLLTNESPDEFNSYFIPSKNNYGYGTTNSLHYLPPKYSPHDTYPISSDRGIHRNKTDFAGYTYKQPSQEYDFHNHNGYYKQNYRPLEQSNRRVVANNFKPSQYLPNTRRKRQLEQLTNLEITKRKKRRVVRTLLNTNSHGKWHMRKKRQSALTGQPLCETRTRYIMPRAAVNQRGNWMYIVNMPEVDNKYMQLVKSEICVSQQCSGLCQLPLGYSSRCEQKYLQRRLIALEESGSQLYTDIFWFPTCCVCTVAK